MPGRGETRKFSNFNYLIPTLIVICQFVVCPAFAAIYIVDNGTVEVADNTSWSGIDGEAYTTDAFPSGAVGYNSLEAIYNSGNGVSGLGPGDEIYLREGTYSENYGAVANTAMPLPWAVDGTGWADDERILFASYPGEWAIIDGNGAEICVLGVHGGGHTPSLSDYGDPDYWVIERLEITGAASASSSSGLGIHSGPFKLRYLFVHNNPASGSSENPGGIRGYRWTGSTVEYCYIVDNACNGSAISDHNCGGIVIFSDYTYTEGRSGFDIATTRRGNEIKYCLFDGTTVGIKDKAMQFLKTSDTDMTHKDCASKYHHNIFLSGITSGIADDTDFIQIYQNIFDNCRLLSVLNRAGVTNADVVPLDRVIYNNTLINSELSVGAGYAEDPGTNKDLRIYIYNNIVDSYGYSSYGPSINIGTWYCNGGNCDLAIAACTPNWDTSVVDRNLVHSPGYADHYSEPYSYGLSSTRWYTTAEFNTYQNVANYTNSTSGLFVGATGADKYRTDGAFVVSGSTTVANGGIDTSHPYLSAVTLPEFVGATKPGDDAWVDGLLNKLVSTAWLKSITLERDINDDPTWVENSAFTGPTVSIADPTSQTTYSTSSSSISLGGVATDSYGTIAAVAWACSTCTLTSGVATPDDGSFNEASEDWTIDSIGLIPGANVITVTATDNDSSTGNNVITITYDSNPGSPSSGSRGGCFITTF